MTKVVQVDWSGGGYFCGNSTSGSTRTERSEGEGWSRAREKRPPEWKSTAPEEKESTGTKFRSCTLSLMPKGLFSALLNRKPLLMLSHN